MTTFAESSMFVGGLVIGTLLAAAWSYVRYKDLLNLRTDREEEEEEDRGAVRGPLTLEHYHWGLVIFAAALALKYPGFGFVDGLSISLIFVETLQKHPFGFRKSHFIASTLFGGLLILIVLMVYL